MKLSHQFVAAALAAGIAQTCLGALPAALPDFKSKAELKQTAVAEQRVAEQAQANAFYTGKPYESSSDGYLFKYRNYDPEASRWTSSDPSGFPNWGNNYIYSNRPLSGFDPNGLIWQDNTGSGGAYTFTHGCPVKRGKGFR